MTTTTIIIALCAILVLGAAANALFAMRGWKRYKEYSDKLYDLHFKEIELQKRKNALDRWNTDIKAQAERQSKSQHVYANVEVDDPDGTAPDFPEPKVYKAMKSQMGYFVVPKFRDYIKVHRSDGKTRYTLDLYVYPFFDEK